MKGKKGRFRLLIRHQLILALGMVLLVPEVVVGQMSYWEAEKSVGEQIMLSAQVNVQQLNHIISQEIEPKIKDVNFLANVLQGKDSAQTWTILNQYKEQHPELETVYICHDTGRMFDVPYKQIPAGYDPRKELWYQLAMQNMGEVVITPPRHSAVSESGTVTIAKTTADGHAVAAVDFNLSDLAVIAKNSKIGENGYTYILDPNGKVIYHPEMASGSTLQGPEKDHLQGNTRGIYDYLDKGQAKKMVFNTNPLTNWKIVGTIDESERVDAARPILVKTWMVIAVALILGLVYASWFVRSLTGRLKYLMKATDTVAAGDLTMKLKDTSGDELGQLASNFNRMIDALRQLVLRVEETSQQVASSAEQLSASAEQTAQATEQVATAIQGVADGVKNQLHKVEENAQAMESMSNSIAAIAKDSAVMADSANVTIKTAEEGYQSVQQSLQQMDTIHSSVASSHEIIQQLSRHSLAIGRIVEVITQIADQTSLLALNAAIEAARAGEQGRGFAVVADEVRKLADQSAESAKHITGFVNEIQQNIERSVQAMNVAEQETKEGLAVAKETQEKFAKILEATKQIVTQVENVSSFAQEISVRAKQITASFDEIASISTKTSSHSQNVATITEEQLAAMEEISASSTSLAQLAEELQKMVGAFKVRAHPHE